MLSDKKIEYLIGHCGENIDDKEFEKNVSEIKEIMDILIEESIDDKVKSIFNYYRQMIEALFEYKLSKNKNCHHTLIYNAQLINLQLLLNIINDPIDKNYEFPKPCAIPK